MKSVGEKYLTALALAGDYWGWEFRRRVNRGECPVIAAEEILRAKRRCRVTREEKSPSLSKVAGLELVAKLAAKMGLATITISLQAAAILAPLALLVSARPAEPVLARPSERDRVLSLADVNVAIGLPGSAAARDAPLRVESSPDSAKPPSAVPAAPILL